MWFYTVIVLTTLGQALSQRDVAPINAAKRVIVQTIEPSLPRIPFEDWLRTVAGAKAPTTWEVNDCGEQTGTAADEGRDFPMCAQVDVTLDGQRHLYVLLTVGTGKKGLVGTPALWSAGVLEGQGKIRSIERLAAVPAAIRQN